MYEKEIFFLRRHPVIFLKNLSIYFVLAFVPVGAYFFFGFAWPDILTNRIGYPLLVLGASAWYLCIWVFAFSVFTSYYLDSWIVTNDRIINIEQKGLFSRTVSELDLYRVQDITSEIKGITPTFFNYGDVFIQTAAETERFDFKQIPNPHEVRDKIYTLVEEDRKFHQR